MYAKSYGAVLHGIDGYIVEVEVNIGVGIPTFEIVGLANTSVREAKERVRAAIENSGFNFPLKRIIVNLAPANLRKDSTGLDLPIAIGILAASGQLKDDIMGRVVFVGELSLQGQIRPVNGVLPMALSAKENNMSGIYTSLANLEEAKASTIDNVRAYSSITSLVQSLKTGVYNPIKQVNIISSESKKEELDMQDVQGQFKAKRAFEIAAAGGHNLLMVGVPGAGKTMLAERINTILPKLSKQEALDVTKIYSAMGILGNKKLIDKRPFRAPHHTITASGMIGGGSIPKAGEVTLSHCGVLFLDELTEFSRLVLEGLRQPLENRKVEISRVNGCYSYPANFSLVVAMNPCPCGYYGDKTGICKCTSGEIQRYYRKISGPLLDRIDLFIDVKRPSYNELEGKTEQETSAKIRERVVKARKIQEKRFKGNGITVNAEMSHKLLQKFAKMTPKAKNILKMAFERMNISARAYDRIVKVARTIADLKGAEMIGEDDIAEAISYKKFKSI